MKKVDNRGMSCPEPLLRTKAALVEAGEEVNLLSIVDNEAAKDNILRYVQKQGLNGTWHRQGNDFHISIRGSVQGSSKPEAEEIFCLAQSVSGRAMIIIGSDRLGRGSAELGALLMRNFIFTLTKGFLPQGVIFINAGVKLCTKGSPVLEELALLKKEGVPILACGTCLDYYNLTDELVTGEITNMYEIVELLSAAPRTISL